MVEPSPKVVHPLAHGVQDVEALDDENVPGGQGVHEEEDVAPVSAEYLPATQPMHTRDEAGRNDPAGHFGHSVDGPEYDEIAVLCDVLSGTQTRPGFECRSRILRKHTPRHTRHAVPSHPAPVRQMVCGHVHVREVCIPQHANVEYTHLSRRRALARSQIIGYALKENVKLLRRFSVSER